MAVSKPTLKLSVNLDDFYLNLIFVRDLKSMSRLFPSRLTELIPRNLTAVVLFLVF